jgi:hypothetical protein
MNHVPDAGRHTAGSALPSPSSLRVRVDLEDGAAIADETHRRARGKPVRDSD